MAERPEGERLQPCLLDRLTNDRPEAKSEGRDQRVITGAQYRRAVLRDLGWLLNTSARLDLAHAADFPDVGSSVLNYGVRTLAGTTASSVTPEQVEEAIVTAIERYEPRIDRSSLRVRAIEAGDGSHNSVAIEIRADIWANPVPEHMYVQTQMDLETGHFRIEDRRDG